MREDDRFSEEWRELEEEEKYKNVALNPDFQAVVIRQGRASGRDTVQWYAIKREEEDSFLKLVLAGKYVERSPILGKNTTPEAWFTPTAERGSPDAQFSLALVYDLGEGVAENDKTAARWYARAAEQGHVGARYNLGLAYDEGAGVDENDETAVSWYLQAAEQGDMKSQFNL
ncbi:MAG: tetratricopeptide repeat protein, partial [Pseudomonadota bacterium]|nr:tetratricopeptide repeat protein [Pseudomonadota bacterium]